MESALLCPRGDLRSDGDDASNDEQVLRDRSGSYAPNIIHTSQSLLQPPAGEPGRSNPKRPRRSKQQADCPRAHRGVGRISQYSEDEWDAYKATLYQLYMVEGRTLQEVQQIMKAAYLFPATTKMFKTRFKRWGWFKNISRKHPSRARAAATATATATATAGEGEEWSLVTRGHRRGRLMMHMSPASVSVAPRWLNLPDHLAFQELPLVTSRAYVRSQFEGQGWVAEALGTKQVRADHDRFDFTESETTILWTLHLMKTGCVKEAYETLHTFCEVLRKGVTTLHPLMLYEFWLLWRKAYDICVMVKDDKFDLLRALITFLCDATENNFRGTTVSSHPVSRILRFSRSFLEGECSDAVVTHAVNSGMHASARTLEEMLGHDHPTILMTWNTLAWYQRGSAASSQNFVRQYRKALRRAEADLGPESAVAIGILFDYLYHVFYVLQQREQEEAEVVEDGEQTSAATTDGCARAMAEDLLRRCAAQMAAVDSPGEPLVIVFRAYASAMLMVGILELEAGDTALFGGRMVEAAATLRRKNYSEMAQMLELDHRHLLVAVEEKKDLRNLPLNLSRPRCSDAEREVYV
ncbi:Clr5 domain-containing protein [Apiospora phragmitis]|uniref:Clr5 domain-containing protein n=1 Tax=Apiospora phragmitis TaxID=2905665 RepID=A0ABR1T746_9PEZI